MICNEKFVFTISLAWYKKVYEFYRRIYKLVKWISYLIFRLKYYISFHFIIEKLHLEEFQK